MALRLLFEYYIFRSFDQQNRHVSRQLLSMAVFANRAPYKASFLKEEFSTITDWGCRWDWARDPGSGSWSGVQDPGPGTGIRGHGSVSGVRAHGSGWLEPGPKPGPGLAQTPSPAFKPV